MFIVKIILCLIILELSTYIGNMFSKKLDKRLKEYIELQEILEYIKGNIEYLQKDILEIFEDLYIKYKEKNWGIIFKNILEEININNENLEKAVKNAIKKSSFLFNADLNILENVANNLGKSDVDNQINNLKLYEIRLKEEIRNATENKKKNEKVYKTIGLVCGIMLVIVLI